MKRILTLFIATILFAALLAPASAFAASPAQTTEQIFNSVSLTPRLSTNPTVASYTKSVMAKAVPTGSNLSGYQQLKAVYDWTHNNIAFAAHYILPAPEEVSTYPEDAAIWGFEEGEGPCEVDAAVFMYLARYIGYDAQWTYGRAEGDDYHYWVEILIDGKAYAFDTYPNMEKSFQLRTEPTLSGFPVVGYFLSGGPINYNPANTTDCANVGNMNRMQRLDGTLEPTFGYALSSTATSSTGQIMTYTKNFNGDYPNFTWKIPYTTKKEMKVPVLASFIPTGGTAAERAQNEIIFSGVADKAVEKTVEVLELKSGTVIPLDGASEYLAVKLNLKDGKLYVDPILNALGAAEKAITTNAKVVDLGGGKSYRVFQKGDSLSYTEGYYLLSVVPYNGFYAQTDPKSPQLGTFSIDRMLGNGFAVIHVVK